MPTFVNVSQRFHRALREQEEYFRMDRAGVRMRVGLYSEGDSSIIGKNGKA